MGADCLGAMENCRFPIPFLDGKWRYSLLLQQNRVYDMSRILLNIPAKGALQNLLPTQSARWTDSTASKRLKRAQIGRPGLSCVG
jgi:hypothetical protein